MDERHAALMRDLESEKVNLEEEKKQLEEDK